MITDDLRVGRAVAPSVGTVRTEGGSQATMISAYGEAKARAESAVTNVTYTHLQSELVGRRWKYDQTWQSDRLIIERVQQRQVV